MELNALICGDARVSHDGRIELTGVFNELFAAAFPATQARIVLVAMLVWDAGEKGSLQFTVDLVGPSKKSVFTIEGHTEVPELAAGAPPPKTQLVLPLHNVMFPVAGRYRFSFQVAARRVDGPSLYLCEEAQQRRL
jgi:Family of unknown function (DUF6941)